MRSRKKAVTFQNTGRYNLFADLGQCNPVGVVELQMTWDLRADVRAWLREDHIELLLPDDHRMM